MAKSRSKFAQVWRAPGGPTDLILAAFEEEIDGAYQDLTTEEVVARTGVAANVATSTLGRMTKECKRRPQLLHIVGYDWDSVHGKRPYPRPVYRLGPGKNKELPPKKVRNNASQRKSWHAKKSRCVTSVFSLATPIRDRPLISSKLLRPTKQKGNCDAEG